MVRYWDMSLANKAKRIGFDVINAIMFVMKYRRDIIRGIFHYKEFM